MGVAHDAIELAPNPLRAAVFCHDPGAILPWWAVPHMTRMAAGKVGYPVSAFVLMKTDNALLQVEVLQ
jgi:hypothetical protein